MMLPPGGKHSRIESELAFDAETQIKLVILQTSALIPTMSLQRSATMQHRWAHRRDILQQQHCSSVAVSVVCPVGGAVNDPVIFVNEKSMAVGECRPGARFQGRYSGG